MWASVSIDGLSPVRGNLENSLQAAVWPGPLLLLLAELVYESRLAAGGGASIMTRRHRGVTSAAEAVLPRLESVTRCETAACQEAAAGEVTKVVVASGPGVLHTGDYSGDLLIIAPSSPPHSSQGRGSTCSILLKIRLHEEV